MQVRVHACEHGNICTHTFVMGVQVCVRERMLVLVCVHTFSTRPRRSSLSKSTRVFPFVPYEALNVDVKKRSMVSHLQMCACMHVWMQEWVRVSGTACVALSGT